jgi:hypothetical protein
MATPPLRGGRLNHATSCYLPQSSSASRFTAAQTGFFILSQSGERRERWIESFLFDTISSHPAPQPWPPRRAGRSGALPS